MIWAWLICTGSMLKYAKTAPCRSLKCTAVIHRCTFSHQGSSVSVQHGHMKVAGLWEVFGMQISMNPERVFAVCKCLAEDLSRIWESCKEWKRIFWLRLWESRRGKWKVMHTCPFSSYPLFISVLHLLYFLSGSVCSRKTWHGLVGANGWTLCLSWAAWGADWGLREVFILLWSRQKTGFLCWFNQHVGPCRRDTGT